MKNNEIGTFIDGPIATEALDSSGERIKISGIDISSVFENKDVFLNWEHKSDNPSQIIGKLLYAKKIFKKSDCENERQEYFFNKNRKEPLLYGYGVLFDKLGHNSAQDAAALFKFATISKETDGTSDIGFSIEGTRLGAKEGSTIPKCIMRSLAITQKPCNKTCLVEAMSEEDVEKYTKSISKKSVSDIVKKAEEEISTLQKTEFKRYFPSNTPKPAKVPNYTKISQTHGESREAKPINPKRTFTPTNAPDKLKVGDRIDYTGGKPKAQTGAKMYRDLYKDMENPVRKMVRSSSKKDNKSLENQAVKVLKSEFWDSFESKESLIKDIRECRPNLSEDQVVKLAKHYVYVEFKKKEKELIELTKYEE